MKRLRETKKFINDKFSMVFLFLMNSMWMIDNNYVNHGIQRKPDIYDSFLSIYDSRLRCTAELESIKNTLMDICEQGDNENIKGKI